jgi:hypothetical protein
MNWNEWRLKWGMFWLFVLVLIIVVAGCSTKVDVLDPHPFIVPENFRQDHLETNCKLHQLLEEPRGPECNNLRLT